MSRFSRKEAERAGWRIVHDEEEHDIVESSTQGRVRHVPRNIRAEKDLGAGLGIINAQAETEGKLLEQIAFQEAQLEAAAAPKGTVIVGDGEVITEEEYQARLRERDLAADQFVVGADVDSGALAREQEEARTAAQYPDYPTKQVELDPREVSIDSPGATGTGLLIVREDEDSVSDVAERREREKEELESSKSMEADRTPEGGVEPYDSRVEESTAEETARVHSEAVTAKAIEIRDKEGAGEADKPEHGREALAAGAEAQEELIAERKEEAEEDADPDASPQARELAEANGVDLEDIDGSGEDGRILKSDVEAYLDAEAADDEE